MSDILETLNEAQKEAVTHKNGPLLIVAGAGTGKTTVLTKRYVYLLQTEKLETDRIVALTFTEKAAQEMEDRILEMLPNGTYDFWIHTFHGLCQRILERHGLEIGIPNKFRIVTETDAWILLKRRFEELDLDHYRPLGNPIKFLHALIQHISRAKDEGITPDQYVEFAENAKLDGDTEIVTGERKRLVELANAYASYQRILRDEGALDFGDIIMETLRLFKERPAILNQYREQFKYLMVDEFQDTNWAQYELIKLLVEPEQNVTVVGDDDQAIYKFRGASLANILQFKDDYPNTKTVALNTNYRSHQEILDTAYTLITKNNPYRLEEALSAEGVCKKLGAHHGTGASVEVVWHPTLEEEAEWIAEDLSKAHQEKGEGARWSDNAILVRSNDTALPFVHALAAKGIPFRFFALRGLYGKPVIIDVSALLTLAVNPEDDPAAWRVLSLPCFKLPMSALCETLKYAQRKGCSIWSAFGQMKVFLKDPSVIKEANRIIGILEKLAESARREPPLAVLHHAVHQTGLLQEIMSRSEQERIDMIQLLNGFVSRIKRYEQSVHAPNAKEFLEELRMEMESGESGALQADAEAGPDVVRILTVHASKGLEFETVYLVSLVDQRFPTRERTETIPLPDGLVQERSQEGNVHLQEERRLGYVAMTRAKKRLVLTGAEHYGGVRKKKPSAFLEESGLEAPAVAKKTEAKLVLPQVAERRDTEVALKDLFPLKRRFSFTQLVAYKKCPMQYKFAHVYRIPILGAYQKSFGQSVHLALHQILQKQMERGTIKQENLFEREEGKGKREEGLKVSIDEAKKIYEEAWIDEWYPDRKTHDQCKKEGWDGIKVLIAKWGKNPPPVKALELGFDWRIGEHSIKGKVDRIDEDGDGVIIYDYKTSEYKEGQRTEPADRDQLHIYQLAMEDRGWKVNRLVYLFVRGGAELEIPCLEGDKKTAFREAKQQQMQDILASDFSPNPSPFICKYCDFKDICEYRKI